MAVDPKPQWLPATKMVPSLPNDKTTRLFLNDSNESPFSLQQFPLAWRSQKINLDPAWLKKVGDIVYKELAVTVKWLSS